MATSEEPGHDPVARWFHWSIALLVLVQIPAGIAMTSEGLTGSGLVDPLFILHKGSGAVLLVLVLARIAWRVTHPAPPFPDHMPLLEQRIAGLAHVGLYVLLVVQTVSGYVRTVADDYPIELLDRLGVPPLLPVMPDTAQLFLVVHQFSAYALTALIAVHVAAVMRHHLIEGDEILSRMWPPALGRRSAPEQRGDGPADREEGPERVPAPAGDPKLG